MPFQKLFAKPFVPFEKLKFRDSFLQEAIDNLLNNI